MRSAKNLDVPETSLDQVTEAGKGSAGQSALAPYLSVVSASSGRGRGGREQCEREPRRRYRPKGTRCLTLNQATNLIEAVHHAKKIGRSGSATI